MAGLIAVDLDGTLLDGRGRVSEGNRRAVDRLREAGWMLVPATGRSWRESRRTLEAIGHDGVAVTAGGSVMSDARSGETIDRIALDAPLVGELAAALVQHGLVAHLLRDHHACDHDYCMVGTGALDPATTWWLDQHAVPVRHVESIEASHLLNFQQAFKPELDRLRELQDQGLVVVDGAGIEVTPMGWFFVRGVAMVFDRYLQADRNRTRFSKII